MADNYIEPDLVLNLIENSSINCDLLNRFKYCRYGNINNEN